MSTHILKMIKNKKSQIEMGETVAVLIIFFILLVLSFVYFTFIKAGEVNQLIQEKEAKESIRISQEATFLPELACSHEGVIRNDCIDRLKLEAFDQVSGDAQDLYFDRLLFSKVTVREIYPDNTHQWPIYNKPNLNLTSSKSTQIPVSILTITNEGKERYSFGYIEVTYYHGQKR